MIWNNSIGTQDYLFILLFLIFYIGYIIRVSAKAKKLNTTPHNVYLKLIIRTIYFSCLIIAILGPSAGKSTKEVKSKGKDIFIAVDLSKSMNAYDIQPTRLQKTKNELKKIVKAFSSDRIGLIIFSGDAFLQCPLTFDSNALLLFIETLNTELVPNTGTDFAPPLQLAFEKYNKDENLIEQQKSKVIILISDGEDFGTQANEIAQTIKDSGIKLFTLGVGTSKGSLIPTQNGFKKDRQGKEVISRLEASALKNLASQTKGQYFEINDARNDTDRLINTINKIEGELRETKTIDVQSNKYHYALLIALIFISLDLIINLKVIRL